MYYLSLCSSLASLVGHRSHRGKLRPLYHLCCQHMSAPLTILDTSLLQGLGRYTIEVRPRLLGSRLPPLLLGPVSLVGSDSIRSSLR